MDEKLPGYLAKIERVTLHHVTSNTELCEGRGATVTVGWFLDRGVAERAAKGRYVMGTDCPIETTTKTVARMDSGALHLLGEKIEVSYEDPEQVKRRALAKLTPEEMRALGLPAGWK